MIQFLELLILFLSAPVPKNEAVMKLSYMDVVSFEDVEIGNRLAASFKVFKKISKIHCALKCKMNPDCISFNFCNSLICQLNSQDAFFPNASFIKTEGCTYQGVKRNTSAECVGVYFAECGLGGLKQQVEWSQWEHSIVIDTSEEWKKIETKVCRVLDNADSSYPCTFEQSRTLEWLKFVHEANKWDDAKLNCENFDGHLFDSLNGTKSQLDFFYDKMKNESFWLGVSTEDHVTWKRMDGSPIESDLLVWKESEPNNYQDVQFHVLAKMDYSVRSYLADIRKEVARGSLCDLS